MINKQEHLWLRTATNWKQANNQGPRIQIYNKILYNTLKEPDTCIYTQKKRFSCVIGKSAGCIKQLICVKMHIHRKNLKRYMKTSK